MTIQLFDNTDCPVDFKRWVFPGGEIGVQLDTSYPFRINDKFRIEVKNQVITSEDFMVILNLIDALNRLGTDNINLYMPYLPYARQDRVCNDGESFALKVFLNALNTVNFKKLSTLDVHNHHVTVDLCDIKNFYYEDYNVSIFVNLLNKYDYLDNNTTIVLPDKGAAKKIAHISQIFKGKIVVADKVRGTISGIVYHTIPENPSGKVLVLDDICDGGATFLSLAACLTNAKHVILAVTHGIFSKGLDELLNYYDEIVCCNNMSDIPSVGHCSNFHQIGN